jgi:hypothetical protein
MFDPTRRDDRRSWFGESLFSGIGDPRWFEQRAAWDEVPARHTAEPVVRKPPWWQRVFHWVRRD